MLHRSLFFAANIIPISLNLCIFPLGGKQRVMRKSIFAKVFSLVLAITIVVPAFGGVAAQDAPATVVDIVVNSEDHNTLETAVVAAGLVEALSNPDAEFTVFAPVDAAFADLPSIVVEAALANTDLLTSLLTYHVVEGRILSGDIAEGCTDVETLNGATITVCNDMGNVTVNSATVTAADLEAGNGVVHVIDRVIIPPVELPAVDPSTISGPIITAGSSTVAPLTTAVAQRWQDAGGVDVPTVDSIGTGAGFERFCEALESDISNASRPIRDSEIETCVANGRVPLEIRVGTDALAVTVSAENDFVDNLTLEQLAAIFSGQVETWADVNPDWPDEEILLYSPGTDSGTFDYFVEAVLDENADALLNANPELSENDDVLVEGVSGSPFAIGYFGYAYYIENTDILHIVDIEGVTPSAANVDNGSYPLARPLFIYTTAEIMAEKPQVAAFVAFYLNNLDEALAEVGYFPANADDENVAKLSWLIATGNIG